MSVNKVILLGNVGKDPEVRHIDSNVSVARFSLATSEVRKNKAGEKVTNTEWHNVVAWRNLAELAEKYIKKGSQLYIEGKITSRQWDDKDGNKRYTTEIIADSIQMIGKRNEGEENSQGSYVSSVESVTTDNDFTAPADNDLPF